MSGPLIMAVDPGLDVAGVAIFDLAAYRQAEGPDTVRALLALLGTFELRTEPADPLPVRLAELASDAISASREHAPALIYVEKPAIEGTYGRNRAAGKSNRRAVNRSYEARGAIIGGFGVAGATVLELPVLEVPKAIRHSLLEAAEKESGRKLPRGPRGGTPLDVWDAIFVGAQALGSRVERDLSDLRMAETASHNSQRKG